MKKKIMTEISAEKLKAISDRAEKAKQKKKASDAKKAEVNRKKDIKARFNAIVKNFPESVEEALAAKRRWADVFHYSDTWYEDGYKIQEMIEKHFTKKGFVVRYNVWKHNDPDYGYGTDYTVYVEW